MRLPDATIVLARRSKLLKARSLAAAIDSTGMNCGSASIYYGHRTGRCYHRYPKVSAVLDIPTQLFLGAVIDRGPKPDDVEFHRVARQVHRRHPFDALLGDVGYDGEAHHAFLWQKLCVLGIIPPMRGRPAQSTVHRPGTFYRGFMADHWPIAEYGQRRQIECGFSMFKRLLDNKVRSRRPQAIDNEIVLRILTLNLMILLLRAIQGLLNRAEESFFAR